MQSSGIVDLGFRPTSYVWPLGLEKRLLSRIKGAERKAAVERLVDGGHADEIPGFRAQSALSNEARRAVGVIHPASMGGEY